MFCIDVILIVFFFLVAILEDLEKVINLGFNTLQIQKTPHLALVSKNFYEYVSTFTETAFVLSLFCFSQC